MAAAHYQLDNPVIINDKNGLQLAGATRDILNSDPLDENGAPLAWKYRSATETIWLPSWPRWKTCRRAASRTC